jgi:UDPglucose 6-dehydrogenase
MKYFIQFFLKNKFLFFIFYFFKFFTLNGKFTLEEIKREIMKGISLDMSNVNQSLEELINRIINSEEVMKNPLLLFKERIIIQKSTVPIETLKKLHELIKEVIISQGEKLNKICENIQKNFNIENFTNFSNFDSLNFTDPQFIDFYVSKYFPLINIPEFLAEGTAVTNLISPDRVILGYLKNTFPFSKKICENIIHSLYSHWISPEKILTLDSNSSELTKLLSNAFLGQRISSINSITELCELTNSNINHISQSVGSDSRIGKNYLKASMGFGGSCLKKDILSLIYILYSKNLNIQAEYWVNTLLMNEYQRIRIAEMVCSSVEKRRKINEGEGDNTVTIFGLSFKGNTNDTRGSNAIFLISYLLNKGIKVKIWDPLVSVDEVENELKLYENFSKCHYEGVGENFDEKIIFSQNFKKALNKSSALVFCNNHTVFNEMDLTEIRENMSPNSVIFDLYDIFEEEKLKSAGFENVFKLGVYSDL